MLLNRHATLNKYRSIIKRIVSNNRAELYPQNIIHVSMSFLGNDKDLHNFLQHTYAVLLHEIVYPTWSNG